VGTFAGQIPKTLSYSEVKDYPGEHGQSDDPLALPESPEVLGLSEGLATESEISTRRDQAPKSEQRFSAKGDPDEWVLAELETSTSKGNEEYGLATVLVLGTQAVHGSCLEKAAESRIRFLEAWLPQAERRAQDEA
jgi:hypothetical protein